MNIEEIVNESLTNLEINHYVHPAFNSHKKLIAWVEKMNAVKESILKMVDT
jgi:hypothetical protein